MSKDKAEARRKSLTEQDELETVHSADESSPLTGASKFKGAGAKISVARSMVKVMGAMGEVVQPGVIDCELIIEYFMHGPPNAGVDEAHQTSSDHLKESVERSMYAIFDDRFFLHDAFKGLDEGGTGVLSEAQMRHWVSCIDNCSPVQQATTEPSTRCRACMTGKMSSSQSTVPERLSKTLYGKPPAPKSSTPYKCKCVPCAPADTTADWMKEVGWVSAAVAATTLDDMMENIIVDVLQKRAAIAPELAEKGDKPETFFDWHDFLVVTMDFYVALGAMSMHAIFAVLLGNEAAEVGPPAGPKPVSASDLASGLTSSLTSDLASGALAHANGAIAAGLDAAGLDAAGLDGDSTRPAARAAFGSEQVIGVDKGKGGLFGCFRPKKEATATAAAAAPASPVTTVADI